MSESLKESVDGARAACDASEFRSTPSRERLIASGRLKTAVLDLVQLGRPSDLAHELPISAALNEQRYES